LVAATDTLPDADFSSLVGVADYLTRLNL